MPSAPGVSAIATPPRPIVSRGSTRQGHVRPRCPGAVSSDEASRSCSASPQCFSIQPASLPLRSSDVTLAQACRFIWKRHPNPHPISLRHPEMTIPSAPAPFLIFEDCPSPLGLRSGTSRGVAPINPIRLHLHTSPHCSGRFSAWSAARRIIDDAIEPV